MLDPKEIGLKYPAIDMLPYEPLSHSTYQFLHDALNKCKHVTTLYLWEFAGRYKYRAITLKDFDQFFGLMETNFMDKLTKIIINRDTFELKDINNDPFVLSIDGHSEDVL